MVGTPCPSLRSPCWPRLRFHVAVLREVSLPARTVRCKVEAPGPPSAVIPVLASWRSPAEMQQARRTSA
eukprot:8852418-Alexandrium_andersonii.AAC.1